MFQGTNRVMTGKSGPKHDFTVFQNTKNTLMPYQSGFRPKNLSRFHLNRRKPTWKNRLKQLNVPNIPGEKIEKNDLFYNHEKHEKTTIDQNHENHEEPRLIRGYDFRGFRPPNGPLPTFTDLTKKWKPYLRN